jgi:hypothetical protein
MGIPRRSIAANRAADLIYLSSQLLAGNGLAASRNQRIGTSRGLPLICDILRLDLIWILTNQKKNRLPSNRLFW